MGDFMTTTTHQEKQCVIIGGGPAGLTAALELSRHGIPATVLSVLSILIDPGQYIAFAEF